MKPQIIPPPDYWTALRKAHRCALNAHAVRRELAQAPRNLGVVCPDWTDAARQYLALARCFPPLPLP